MKQLFFLLTCLLIMSSCGQGGNASSKGDQSGTTFKKDDVVNEVKDGLANSSQEQVDLRNIVQGKMAVTAKPAISVEALKSIFPERVEGFNGKELKGEQNSVLGYPCTFISREYRNGNMIARVALTDTGGDPRSVLGLTPWAVQVLNKDESEFYERTRTFGGFPAHERWIHSSKVSNFDYVIDNRWVVSIHGRQIPMETIHKIAGFVKPATLRKLN